MTATISFVVPAYNVERYLDECLDSIVASCQPGDHIVLVNDGSKDGTAALCTAWAQRHPTLITLLNQTNQGLSAARNHALPLAHGDYVLFMDSDDVVRPQAVAQARRVLSEQAPDILAMTFNWWWPEQADTRKRPLDFSHPKGQLLQDREAFCTDTFRDALLSACSRFFKRSLLDQLAPDVFPVGKSYEEIASIPRLTLRARSLYHLDEALFDYRIRAGSITQSKTPKHCLELAQALTATTHEVRACGLSAQVELAANMAAGIILMRALRDCGSVPSGPSDLYRQVWQGGLQTLSRPLPEVVTALASSGWHDARKAAKHLRMAHAVPRLYILSRQLIYGWKRRRAAAQSLNTPN